MTVFILMKDNTRIDYGPTCVGVYKTEMEATLKLYEEMKREYNLIKSIGHSPHERTFEGRIDDETNSTTTKWNIEEKKV